MESQQASDAGAQVLIQTALGRLRMEMEHADAPWLAGHDEEARRAHRELGRRLLQEIARAAPAPELSDAARAGAGSIGREYAALSMGRSLSLSEAVRAFLFFRDTLVDALVQMAGALEPIAAPSWQAVHHQLSAFLNEVLIALVQVYEEKRA
jgi:hypothetical protein